MDENTKRDWRFVRSETMEILGVLNDKTLLFKPDGDKWRPLYYQFACMARTQLVYARALAEGAMDFAYFGDHALPDKHGAKTKQELQQLLEHANKTWIKAMDAAGKEIKWPGMNVPTTSHASRLMGHERIHHGQLIAYFTLAGIDLPSEFKKNWAL